MADIAQDQNDKPDFSAQSSRIVDSFLRAIGFKATQDNALETSNCKVTFTETTIMVEQKESGRKKTFTFKELLEKGLFDSMAEFWAEIP